MVDPYVPPGGTALRQVELTVDEVQHADAVVVVTDHDDFDYELIRNQARYVLDTRNRINGPQVELL